MARFCIAIMMMFLMVSPALAEEQRCYQKPEAIAEQAIRIQSELMVIGLNCQHMGARAGYNLYGMYREFAAKYADMFAGYERQLMAFFGNYDGSSPEQELNALRTKYANQISKDVAKMRPDVFCSRYASRILETTKMTQDDLHDWAATFYADYPVSYPFCSPDTVAMNR